ncbi:MAG: hypothetical protein QXR50_04640 [Archaeoglobaceae archaeon]
MIALNRRVDLAILVDTKETLKLPLKEVKKPEEKRARRDCKKQGFFGAFNASFQP